MPYFVNEELPKDLPENWLDDEYVSPNGIEVGLSNKHGYNYLMKQVNDSQSAILTIDNILASGNTNLIDNSYFINPINRNKGFVVLPSTTYYTDIQLTSDEGVLIELTDANYLNDDASCVDFEGDMYYVRTADTKPGFIVDSKGSFVFDRWWAKSCTLLKRYTYGNLAITGPSTGSGIMKQAIQNSDSLAGRAVVFSVLVTNISGNASISLYKSNSIYSTSDTLIATTKLSYGLNYVTAYVPEDIGRSNYRYLVCSIEVSAKAEISVSACKLQTGMVPTLAYYEESEDEWRVVDIPNPVVETLRCNGAPTSIGGIGMLLAPEDIGLHTANTMATAELI